MYSIAKDTWHETHPMQEERTKHSGCCLDGKIYVSCGYSGNLKVVLNSIEVFNAKQYVTVGDNKRVRADANVRWQLINLEAGEIKPR